MLVVGIREANGETLYLCPEEAHAPHTLIAGTTGSGKSVLIQNLLLDIAVTNDCANAQDGKPQWIWIEELIEQSTSSPVYPLLKRSDERHVTMQAYDRPVFAEDLELPPRGFFRVFAPSPFRDCLPWTIPHHSEYGRESSQLEGDADPSLRSG